MQINQKTSCIWVYLWFLDKVTKIDEETNLGRVLGGKPIKIEEDLKEFGNRKTVITILKKLEQEGYIKTIRTPYGKSIFVTKAKKFFGNKIEKRSPKSGTSLQQSGTSLPPKRQQSGTSNKTIQYYNTEKEKQVSQSLSPTISRKESYNKNMKKSSFKYNENMHEDEFESVVDLDTGEIVIPEKKPKVRKDQDVTNLQNAFIEICEMELNFKPIKDAKGYMAVRNALLQIEYDNVIDMYERWFKQSGRPKEDLIAITKCLSNNEINKYRLQKQQS